MKALILSLLGLGLYLPALAADRPIAQPIAGKLERIPGQPIRWKWPNGNQAMLIETTGDLKPLTAGMTFTKNTCLSAPPAKCYFKSMIRQRVIAVVWEKHRNKRKIGTLVDRIGPADSEPTILTKHYIIPYLVTQISQMVYQSRGYNPPPAPGVEDLFVCDDFSWIPGLKNDSTVRIDSWLAQFEFVNDQLNMSTSEVEAVNQFYTAAHGVVMELKSPNELRLKSLRSAATLFDFNSFGFNIAYSGQLTFDRKKVGVEPAPSQGRKEWSDPACRVEYMQNFSEVFTGYNNLTEKDVPVPKVGSSHSKPVIFDEKDPLVAVDFTGLIGSSVEE